MKRTNKNRGQSADGSDNHMAASDEVGRGYLTGPGLHEFPVEYAIVDGLAIHEGCIELGTVEEVQEEAARIRASHMDRETSEAAGLDGMPDEVEEKGVGLPSTSSFLWTGGVVAYTIASDVPNQERVANAIQHIESMTAIRFVQRTNENAAFYPNYVEIISNGNEGWSSSAVGMRGGRQLLRYADHHSWQILVHEFLHTLGVYHEQSRSDRDEFVEIRWDNIQDGPPPPGEINAIGNFQTKPDSVNYFDYDYGSIMHYPGTSFAKDPSQPTIVPRQPGVTIGQRQGMSYGDRQTIAKMYERFFQQGYAGVWRAGTGGYGLWVNASWQSFIDKWNEWSNLGLRLHDIQVHRRAGHTLYSGNFLPGSGPYGLWANVDWASFRNKWQEWSNQGLRLVDLHIHRVNNQNRYSGVFLPGTGGYGLWVNADWTSFRDKWQEWGNRGLRLVDIHVHRVNNQDRYSGVFLPGTGVYGLWANATWPDFFSKWQEWSSQGLRLVDLNMHRVGDSIRYSGVFLPGNDSYYLWANVTFESFRAKWEELAAKGLRLIDFEIANAEDEMANVEADGGAPSDIAYSSRELEGFGGFFGYEAQSEAVGYVPSLEEGGGGIGTGSHNGAASDMVEHGSAHFPTSTTEIADEQQGLGGIFFDGAAANSPATEVYGGMVLPSTEVS